MRVQRAEKEKTREIELPEFALVVLIGPSGAGKSTFAATHFLPTEVVSSDVCRGLVSDNPNEQKVSSEAFDLLHTIVDKRLGLKRLTVVDATNVEEHARRALLRLAKKHHALTAAVVLDFKAQACFTRNKERADRNFGIHVVRRHSMQLRKGLKGLSREGFHRVHHFKALSELSKVNIKRVPLWNDKRAEQGPFDIIGDVHGCFDELMTLLGKLGYEVCGSAEGLRVMPHPEGRRLIWVGDLVDRGPKSPEVLEVVMNAVKDGVGFCVPGNHDVKALKAVQGRKVTLSHGLAETMEQLEERDETFKTRVTRFLDGLVSHLILDGGNLVVAHAGIKEKMQGRASSSIRNFCLYGAHAAKKDDDGLPVREAWADEYRGDALVVFGHNAATRVRWVNNTACIDTGCVFGGRLTALRYPERDTVQVEAQEQYWVPTRPLSSGDEAPRVLKARDISGTLRMNTELVPFVKIGEAQASAALEEMARFAVDPRWLIYLPPTMSPPRASDVEGFLEHPTEAFDYFAKAGVKTVVCQEKHMGSRALVVVCRSKEAAERRFGVGGTLGRIYTRRGRPFFSDPKMEEGLLVEVALAMEKSGLWQKLNTDWVLLDAELMPWSAKADQLVKSQYAATGASGRALLDALSQALGRAARRGLEVHTLGKTQARKSDALNRYTRSYRHYVEERHDANDLRLAPFHILAAEGQVFKDRSHVWHMETLEDLAGHGSRLVATQWRTVDLEYEQAVKDATAWWLELTADGGEGFVVKPECFVARNHEGYVLQPAIKCRGKEYLRIIYGPEYLEHLGTLRRRAVGKKRAMAKREFALGLQGLKHFVEHDVLTRVHACAFAVLASETEAVDPTL